MPHLQTALSICETDLLRRLLQVILDCFRICWVIFYRSWCLHPHLGYFNVYNHHWLSRQTRQRRHWKDCNYCWNMNMCKDTVEDAVWMNPGQPSHPQSRTYQGSVITCVNSLTAWFEFLSFASRCLRDGLCGLLLTLRICYMFGRRAVFFTLLFKPKPQEALSSLLLFILL